MINRVSQVWATDITYIPMSKGFVYLTVIMDWYSRRILSWRLSNSLDSSFCVDALEEALHHYGKPEIFNSDQGSQYTSDAFTDVLKANETSISMDGKGAWRDNVFVERLWRSVKYEEVYLNAYESMLHAKTRLKSWIEFYKWQLHRKIYNLCRQVKKRNNLYRHRSFSWFPNSSIVYRLSAINFRKFVAFCRNIN